MLDEINLIKFWQFLFKAFCIVPLLIVGIDIRKIYRSMSQAARITVYYSSFLISFVLLFITLFGSITTSVYLFYYSSFPIDHFTRKINFRSQDNFYISKILLKGEEDTYKALCSGNEGSKIGLKNIEKLESICKDIETNYFDLITLS